MILSIAQHAPAKRRLSLIFSRNFDALGSRCWTRAVRKQVLLRCLTDCNNLTGQTLAVILRSINHVKVSVLFAGLTGRTSLRRRSSEFPNISMVYAWTAWIVLRILRSTEIKTKTIGFITYGRNPMTGSAAYRTASPPGISVSWDARRSAASSPSRGRHPGSAQRAYHGGWITGEV